jgi:hypothetical protein
MISMAKALKPKKSLGISLIVLWMAINVLMSSYMILSHPEEPNSFLEVMLWIPSIAGLWLMKKWGATVAVATLCITLGISMGNLLLIYQSSTMQLVFVPVNSLRVILNASASVYLFKYIFANRFS